MTEQITDEEIEALNKYENPEQYGYVQVSSHPHNHTIKKLIASHQAMQWRSVDDELPEDGQWVLVETFTGEVLIAVHIGKGMWHTYCETGYSVDVVMRWMILPEAIDYDV